MLLTPKNVLAAYAAGYFPMADENGRIQWLAPDPRAVLELDSCRPSRSLRGVIRQGRFQVVVNRGFTEVVSQCAARTEGTWISPEILDAYGTLHELGYAHSVESWRDDQLVGGLYGVALGGAFFGESMFHREDDASKVALVFLVERLKDRNFALLDVQFLTDHLRRFGAMEIPRDDYESRLARAIQLERSFI